MNRDTVIEHIRSNAQHRDIALDELILQPDPFRGWRLVAISPDFEDIPHQDRRRQLLSGLETESFQLAEMLTPLERSWAGSLPLDSDLEQLPLWPEALARVRRESAEQPLFASDLDEDLPPPFITTFYSLRGGVGRSTALSYTARIMARRGYSVLCIDMDLEAPGLASLFGKEAEIQSDQGLVSVLMALDQGEKPDLLKHLIRVSERDELYCLPAGRPDADYARRLRFIDPENWYREEVNPLRDLVDSLGDLPIRPDFVLIDARTGIAPLNAPLLFDLSDLAVVTFYPHPQARTGTEWLVRALLRAHNRRRIEGQSLTPEPRFLVAPLPASSAPDAQRYRSRALDWIRDWLGDVESRADSERPVVEEITHFVPYLDAIATSDATLDEETTWQHYLAIADWLERFVPTRAAPETERSVAEAKPAILKKLRFSSGTAEQQENFLESFVTTDVINDAFRPDKPLVLGRKGTGKTAVFRHLLESRTETTIIALAPAGLRDRYPWNPSPDGFSKVEQLLNRHQRSWREFWNAYIALVSWLTLGVHGELPTMPEDIAPALTGLPPARQIRETELIRCVQRLLQIPGLDIWEWFQTVDEAMGETQLVLFDGLDTGFGSSSEERQRRASAVEGLFAYLLDRGGSLKHLRLKIFLRRDIWDQLNFDNKSHLYGRSVALAWRDQVAYLKTALSQALLYEEFKALLVRGDADFNAYGRLSVARWPDEIVYKAWTLLVGERMKGSNSAFTRNWIWNRLADGNKDHTPRALLQLLHEALNWEREEAERNPYNRALIRPRALIRSLDNVSEQALGGIKEEFPELENVFAALRRLGRTPVQAEDLRDMDELDLAREVGLISVYEETNDGDIRRFTVPEIYRLGLGMARKGQR